MGAISPRHLRAQYRAIKVPLAGSTVKLSHFRIISTY